MRPLALVLAAAASSAACSRTTVVVAPPPPTLPTGPTAGAVPGIVVTADVLRPASTVAVPLAPGQAIARGDQVALDVELDREAYVYVLYVDASGTISDLFPRTGHTRLTAGVQRLPALGRRWETDDLRGQECFVVLASSGPLEPAILHSRAEAGKRSARPGPAATRVRERRWVAPRASECPGTTKGQDTTDVMGSKHCRGPTEMPDGIGIVGTPDASGVATALFWLDHRGR